jgi:hypothetical protein
MIEKRNGKNKLEAVGELGPRSLEEETNKGLVGIRKEDKK